MGTDTDTALAVIRRATKRLLITATGMDDAQARQPSRLPGWTRGHVLTHLARSADGMVNLLEGARAGVARPAYGPGTAREDDIEAGAGRPAAALAADVRSSAARFADVVAAMPEEAWSRPVRAPIGVFPASGVLSGRLTEVELHHVDLDAGYEPGQWTPEFVSEALLRVADAFTQRPGVPRCRLHPDGESVSLWIGPPPVAGVAEPGDDGNGPVTVVGPAWALLAWLTGRGGTAALSTPAGRDLPELPPLG